MVDEYIFPAVMGKEKNEKEYSVYFPDFDVATSGLDAKDALSSARELLGVTIYGMEQENVKIPKPTSLEKVKVSKNEFITLVDVFMPSIRLAEETKSVNRTVTLPAWLNSLAKAKKINFSKVLQEALEVKLNCHIKAFSPVA